MKKKFFVYFLTFLLIFSSVSTVSASNVKYENIENIISLVIPSVVKVSANLRNTSYANEVINGLRSVTAAGSGFIISDNGFILTSYHIIKDAKEIWVTFYDGQMSRTRVIGVSVEFDLAILQPINLNRSFQALKWGNSDQLLHGNEIFIIGNPLGLEFSVSKGIISHPKRLGISPLYSSIQTDAAINQGNSGGPVFNIHGEVIGVAMGMATVTSGNMGLGFAIPSNVAKKVAEQLIQGKSFYRKFFGINVEQFWEVSSHSIMPKGVKVLSLIPNGIAQRHGIQEGDIIIGVNNEEIKKLEEFFNKLSVISGKFYIQLLRNNKVLNINIVVEE